MDWIALGSTAFTIAFVGSFLILAVWESWQPWRALRQSTERRWIGHGILFTGTIVFETLLIRSSPLLVALAVEGKPWAPC